MPVSSLNALQPELVPHGIDIEILAFVGTGTPFPIGEIYEMDYDMDQGSVKLPVLGSRITGERDGKFSCSGTIKSYWINATVRQMLNGAAPTGAGNTSAFYHSKRPFQRFNIQVKANISNTPVMEFVNVVFSKDAGKWTEGSFTEETITWACEDVYEYQN